MQIHLCLVSDNSKAIDLVRDERLGLIPRPLIELLCKDDAIPVFSTRAYDSRKANRGLESFLLERKESQAIIILRDRHYGGFIDHLFNACFVIDLDLTAVVKGNYKNYFSKIISQGLKNFFQYKRSVSDGSNQQAILLPLENFKAEEIQELKTLFRTRTLDPSFANHLKRTILLLKGRRRPRRNCNYANIYFVDDDDKLFDYGKERHAQLETSNPHSELCELTGNFRFGIKIDSTRHYNVTKECKGHTNISGAFIDCHGDTHQITSRTHLNMFSNDQVS